MMVTEQTIGPCPACGIGEFYEHDGWRFCNACGFSARCAVWQRLSGQAARIAELEADLKAAGLYIETLEQDAAEHAHARALLHAVESLEQRMRTDKENVFHVTTSLSYKQPGQIKAALVGRVGAEKKHMGAIDEVREPTLAAALIALGEPAP